MQHALERVERPGGSHEGVGRKKDYTGYIYSMPDGIRIPTLQEHHIDAQDQTPLPIWRLEAYFKYPDGGDLETEEILQ